MINHYEAAKLDLVRYLKHQNLDESSIDRIIRDDLPYLFTWNLQPSSNEELKKADAIIAFSFGFGPLKNGIENPPAQYNPQFYEPGRSNQGLSKTIEDLVDETKTIYAQWEISEAIQERNNLEIETKIYTAKPIKKYLGTSGVLEQFIENGLANFESIIVVAHPHHMFRCVEISKTFFRKHGFLPRLLIADTRDVPYDPESVQPWTRSMLAWVEYEVGCRFQNRYNGNM